MLVVWVSMLPTDWARPSSMVQSRIPDPRVAQFWDKDNLVAKAMNKQLSPTLQPHCCRNDGVLWDLAALYPANVRWDRATPVLIDGPVVTVSARVQQEYLAP